MKIVILNECFVSDAQLEELAQNNEVQKYDVTDNVNDAKDRIKDADIIFVDQFVCPLSNDILDVAENLKLIILNTTSYHLVDLEYLNKRKIALCNTPDFCSTSVAELIFLYALFLARNVNLAYSDNSEKPFEILPDDLSHRKYVGYNLEGKNLGILGLGNIGEKVAKIGNGFGMNVIGYNRSKKNILGLTQKNLQEVTSQSDIIVITLPYSEETKNMLNEEIISCMKQGVIIINISSHEILDEERLIENLKSGKIGGYGLDNFTNKDKGHFFYNSERVMILPHLGFFSQESLDMISKRMIEGYKGFLSGANIHRII